MSNFMLKPPSALSEDSDVVMILITGENIHFYCKIFDLIKITSKNKTMPHFSYIPREITLLIRHIIYQYISAEHSLYWKYTVLYFNLTYLLWEDT